MCGISGIINKNNNQVDYSDIKSMNDLISHRGPDDEGFYFENNIAFGHRRLSILDLSRAGHQPMRYLDDRYVITYNGEIYNYLEIKRELLQYNYRFNSNTDTEIILASYDRWGENCVKRFNGMWAFAIYDRVENIIFCSRDRFGIKPFYYTQMDTKFIFGSEIKQLIMFYTKRYVNKDVLIDYLVFGREEHTNETFFNNIYKLEQAHNLIYNLSNNDFEAKRYYEIKEDANIYRLSLNNCISEYQVGFEDSVKLRLRSDVTVGTCLSGGLDSSSVAVFASGIYAKENKLRFKAIHAKSIEKVTDESPYAKVVAKKCNIDLHIVEPSANDFKNKIDEVIYCQEEPFGSPSVFMQYFVMKEAKKLGCKVMLDGQGGDETLFGYENYFQVVLASYLRSFNIIKYILTLREVKNFKISKLKMVVQSVLTLLSRFRNKRIIKKSFIKEEYLNNDRLIERYYSFNGLQSFQRIQVNSLNLPHLLKYEDKNSMFHSVETRLPFIDYRLVDLTMNINIRHKYKYGYLKYILRKTVEEKLPEEIVWRQNKLGFEAPSNIWLENNRTDMITVISRSNILKSMVRFDKLEYNQKNLWKLFNIARWEELYKVEVPENTTDQLAKK